MANEKISNNTAGYFVATLILLTFGTFLILHMLSKTMLYDKAILNAVASRGAIPSDTLFVKIRVDSEGYVDPAVSIKKRCGIPDSVEWSYDIKVRYAKNITRELSRIRHNIDSVYNLKREKYETRSIKSEHSASD